MALPLMLAGGALAAGGLAGSFLGGKKGGAPDISGELARISAMMEQLRAQNRVNINREAAQGRSAAANNLAARGTYRSPVAQGSFNALEGERLNAIATSDAQLAGQEAQLRTGLLRELLGLDAAAQAQKDQVNAGRFGALTGIGTNLLLASLLRGGPGTDLSSLFAKSAAAPTNYGSGTPYAGSQFVGNSMNAGMRLGR